MIQAKIWKLQLVNDDRLTAYYVTQKKNETFTKITTKKELVGIQLVICKNCQPCKFMEMKKLLLDKVWDNDNFYTEIPF